MHAAVNSSFPKELVDDIMSFSQMTLELSSCSTSETSPVSTSPCSTPETVLSPELRNPYLKTIKEQNSFCSKALHASLPTSPATDDFHSVRWSLLKNYFNNSAINFFLICTYFALFNIILSLVPREFNEVVIIWVISIMKFFSEDTISEKSYA